MKTVPVRMPKLSMATTEGTFLEWMVGDGESVAAEQPLYTVATDKVEAEVPSPATGILRHGEAETEVVYPVGAQLAMIEVADDE
jgi:2-oxoglutarate dehydrogenase E2 component (dihydrolipoamide succinyltransferase)